VEEKKLTVEVGPNLKDILMKQLDIIEGYGDGDLFGNSQKTIIGLTVFNETLKIFIEEKGKGNS
jgi:hypothetical protein